ncbi:hypothetical protein BDF20DRAFT_176459 [Mycotypha africana]|uniref:uncharacterized protein n=1 Tax=Mycotypha africana TaxID=64632 RepID=UPI002301E168|nr:uncharacterized protein BDF20DRAFT_176459 [Mycotypha africana]KAI8968350.1 hypothetical protein BDF20DRAFT_176459 [Mycotypha africana]
MTLTSSVADRIEKKMFAQTTTAATITSTSTTISATTKNIDKKQSMSELRASYPLEELIKLYSPDSMARKLNKADKPTRLVLNGVNILNKYSLDSDIVMNRIKQRKETHNRVERRRRNTLNLLVSRLSDLVPRSVSEKRKGEKCYRAKVLSYAIEYIEVIQKENEDLRRQMGRLATLSKATMANELPLQQ